MATLKRITLHPLDTDGNIDEDINLYPKTLVTGIVDEEGEELDIATQDELDEAIESVGSSISALSDELDNKQDILVAGSNIRTINGESLLGSDDISIPVVTANADDATEVLSSVQIDDTVYEIQSSGMTEITWAELVELRDNGELTPGMQYRITDYECTTVQDNTSSAGHVFDIIVIADSESVLNENARAIQSESDTDGYFSNSNLEAWELKYSIDVPKPYIYSESWGSYLIYSGEYTVNENTYHGFGTLDYDGMIMLLSEYEVPSNNYPVYVSEDGETWEDGDSYGESVDNIYIYGSDFKGIIYYLKDEFNNECPYDFKNVLFTGSSHDESISYTNAYTFTYTEDDSVLYDASIAGIDKRCYNNIIKEYYQDSILMLNFNVFYSTSVTFQSHNNTFSVGCNHNTFSYGCRSNTFSTDCNYNTFSYNCYSNIFGVNCFNNTFGYGCYNNTFGNDCYSNTFGSNCHSNALDNNCTSNIFGTSCYRNTFGVNCHSNTFNSDCRYNTFGVNCHNNTFAYGCHSNTFDSSCYNNTFGSYCYSNTFGNGCCSNTFGVYCLFNTFGSACYYNIFGDSSSTIHFCRYIIFDNDCKYIYLFSDDTTASSSNYLQNIHIHLGVTGSSSSNRLSISVADRNLSYSTDYYAAGSTSIILDE